MRPLAILRASAAPIADHSAPILRIEVVKNTRHLPHAVRTLNSGNAFGVVDNCWGQTPPGRSPADAPGGGSTRLTFGWMDDRGGRSASQHNGRLELTWTNKDQALLWAEDGAYRWVSPSDYRVAEVRLLNDAGQVGEVGPASRRAADNLLICGDALNALTSLARIPEFQREYLGKVKLAYIDPPFNTQQAFEQYDDALEHSVWLTMMRDRLVQIKRLLRGDGSVWVHCDDSEQPYLKVMMDEIYGRENFVAAVLWVRRNDPRNTARHVSTDHDYLIVFARDIEACKFNQLPRTEAMTAAYTNPGGDPRGPWRRGDLARSLCGKCR